LICTLESLRWPRLDVRRSGAVLSIVGVMLWCVGCRQEIPGPASAKPAEAAKPVADEVQIQTIGKPGFDALVAHHPGKVVLIDFWATYCEKCREVFPHTVELSRTLADKGLVVLSVSCDDANRVDEALTFLRTHGGKFQHLRSVHGSDEQTFVDFEIDGGALPHYKLYDRKGLLRHTIAAGDPSGEPFDLATLDKAIEELLAEPK
jgi:thiol-disulfide isomerase/thioredoxin